MPKLIIHPERIRNVQALVELCPFHALQADGNSVVITAACKMCLICHKRDSSGAIEYAEDAATIDKQAWKGILVFVEQVRGEIHPVSLELIGKARLLAAQGKQPVWAVLIGQGMDCQARLLSHYGCDRIYVFDHAGLRDFDILRYTSVLARCIDRYKPSAVLVGATPIGRQLAPRVAARCKTGLTADCTELELLQGSDLIQIRPAFGGNIMARIHTPNHRPQMATVRYQVMDAPTPSAQPRGDVVFEDVPPSLLNSEIELVEMRSKPKEQSLEEAEAIVCVGRGLRKAGDLAMVEKLAGLLDAQIACTRPLVENGWVASKRQIGLSGRTVRPKLLIACGISGAIQFLAGMDHAQTIVAVNPDADAPIFRVAHVGLIGDLYEVLPRLIARLTQAREAIL